MADHVLALERHIGQGVIDVIWLTTLIRSTTLARTRITCSAVPLDHPLRYRYDIVETDLTDPQRPWRHSSGEVAARR